MNRALAKPVYVSKMQEDLAGEDLSGIDIYEINNPSTKSPQQIAVKIWL